MTAGLESGVEDGWGRAGMVLLVGRDIKDPALAWDGGGGGVVSRWEGVKERV